MDVVILAAGRGERLAGRVPLYFKPLLVIDGRSLIMHAIEALPFGIGKVIIVVAPENAHPIVDLLRANQWDSRCRLIIQPSAGGPGEALELGAELCQSDRVMILCGDNLVQSEDLTKMAQIEDEIVVGIRTFEDASIADRFTLFTEERVAIEKPNDVEPLRWSDGFFRAWLGPLIVSRSWCLAQGATALIGPRLSRARLVEVNSHDIGIPEVLP